MLVYAIKRLLMAAGVLFGVSILIFLIIRLTPGDPARLMLGDYATAEDVARLRHELGLDRPLPEQYASFAWGAVRGHLGKSLRTGQPVVKEIADRFPATIELTVVGMGLAIAIGVSLGIVAAAHKGSAVDNISMVGAILGVSMPSFWLGLMLILLFSVKLGWLPSMGSGDWRHVLMPAFSLGLLASTVLARTTRSAMLEVLSQDFIRTARSKGLAERVVLYRHALKNALIPVVTIVGVQVASLLGGTVVIEQLFAWPGVGRLAVQAVLQRDYPLVQAVVLYMALACVLVNLLVDLAYGFLDPRIRY